eukprot:356961-Chlamydomonas_euryale.AAC.4
MLGTPGGGTHEHEYACDWVWSHHAIGYGHTMRLGMVTPCDWEHAIVQKDGHKKHVRLGKIAHMVAVAAMREWECSDTQKEDETEGGGWQAI